MKAVFPHKETGEALFLVQREFAPLAPAWHAWLERTLASQVDDGSAQDGAMDHEGNGWYDGRRSAFILSQLLAVYLYPELVPSEPERLSMAIRKCAAFVVRRQLPDGRLDLGGAYSPNEAGFPVTGIAIAYARLKARQGDSLQDVLPLLETIMKRAGEAILAGSAYTANHRWTAACAPLAALHRLWPDPRYLAKIEDYLADGLDCDEDGCWFEERSPNYNNVANMGLLSLADFLGRPELTDAVVRNGRFTLRCLQPNGEADASFSHRQDRGGFNRRATTYGVARRWAQLSGDGRFTELARAQIPMSDPMDELIPLIFQMVDHPECLPEPQPIEDNFTVLFPKLPLLRQRRGCTALSLSADPGGHFYDTLLDHWGGSRRSDDWFHLHHGAVVLQSMHLAGAGMQNMQPHTLCLDEAGRASLSGHDDGWTHTLHFRPGSPACPMDWNWDYRMAVTWRGDCLDIDIHSESEVSLAAEWVLWVRPGATWSEADEPPQPVMAGGQHPLQGGKPLRIASGCDAVTIDGLPPSKHVMHIQHRQPIPSRIPETCGRLSVGLTFPLKLHLSIRLA
jgi:hypothetical protein